MGTVATLTKTGRAAIAASIAARPIFLGWGAGEVAWDNMGDADLPSLLERETLFNEIGIRKASVVGFCEPSETGDIVVPIGATADGAGVETARYQQKTEPTPYLYIKTAFDFGDAPNDTIREIGIFLSTEPNPDLPPGQMYFTPDQIAQPGDLLAMQIVRPKILRSPSVRQILELVLPV